MKKRIILTVMLTCAMIFLTIGPGSEPVQAAGQVFRLSYVGKGADAGCTTCPSGPATNEVCTDTYISVSEQMYTEDGVQFPSTTLFLYQYSYKVDRRGNWVSVSDTYGYGEANLSIDQKLTRAFASATVPLTTCTVDRRGNYTCVDSPSIAVSASWTGQGDLSKSGSHSHSVSKGYKYNSHFQGTYRNAIADGQVDDRDLDGLSLYAAMYNNRWSDVYISHAK